MKLKITLAFVIGFSMLLSSCAQMAAQMDPSKKYTKDSKFVPPNGLNDYQKHLEQIAPFSKKITTDKVGDWYANIDSDNHFTCSILEDEREVFRSALKGGQGILQPYYTISQTGDVSVDWNSTKILHDFLVKTLRLNLLPLSSSRSYHEKMTEFIKFRVDRLVSNKVNQLQGTPRTAIGLVSTTASALSSDGIEKLGLELSGFLGNPQEYYQKIILSIAPKSEYIVETSNRLLVMDEFGQSNKRMGVIYTDIIALKAANETVTRQMKEMSSINFLQQLDMTTRFLHANIGINFTPIAIYKESVRGGYRFTETGCRIHSIANYKEMLVEMESYYNNSITNALKKNVDQENELHQKIAINIKKSNRSRELLEPLLHRMTKVAFDEFKVAGSIKSSSLSIDVNESQVDDSRVKSTVVIEQAPKETSKKTKISKSSKK